MSVEDNTVLVLRLYDGLFNHRHLALADQLVAEDCVSHGAPPGIPGGPAGLRAAAALLDGAFPDHRFVIEDLIADADKVVVRVTFRGTHTGPFQGIPPTGRRVVQAQIHILRIAWGKAVEHWLVRDDLALLDQLGALPGHLGT